MHVKPTEVPGLFPNDRRSARRFPITLHVKFTALLEERGEEGTGTTINIGSKGMMFLTDTPVSVGSWLGFLIDWPTDPHSASILLAARGRVVHSSDGRIGVALNWHEFRRHESAPAAAAVSSAETNS